ncbi:MAG: hypothetical protein E5W56_10855, partial [Mesorhizobium sp.]
MRLADIGKKTCIGVDAVLEPARIEHPDEEHVLGVVPHVDHQPAYGDVPNDQISDGKDQEVGQHVHRMDKRQAALTRGLEATPNPDRQQYRCRDGSDTKHGGRHRHDTQLHSDKQARILVRPEQDSENR